MPRLSSKYFGELDYSPDAVFQFPSGIPGFEGQTAFVFLEQPHNDPLVFMQSLVEPGLCFVAVPVFVANPHYRLTLAAEDCESLGLPPAAQLRIGEEVLCLALVTVSEGADPTANLASPIVLNLRTHTGLQSVQDCPEYSLQHPLLASEEHAPCS
jgi:flagellar assembly factor FliW